MILTLHILDPIHLYAVTLIKSVDNAESFSLTISHHIGSAQFLLKFFVFWAQINLLVSFYTPHSLCFTNCKIYREVKTDFLVPTIGEKKMEGSWILESNKPTFKPYIKHCSAISHLPLLYDQVNQEDSFLALCLSSAWKLPVTPTPYSLDQLSYITAPGPARDSLSREW